jgi:uncharacterized protein (DUF2147 family)
MKSKFLFLFSLMALALISPVFAQQENADAIVGVWETGNGKAHIQITKSGKYFYGRIVWLRDPLTEQGKPKVDKNNPDPALRSQPIMGLRLLKSFEYMGDNSWEDGTIYDAENGKTYQCKLSMDGNQKLNVRGFVGISLMGRTDVWKRVEPAKK